MAVTTAPTAQNSSTRSRIRRAFQVAAGTLVAPIVLAGAWSAQGTVAHAATPSAAFVTLGQPSLNERAGPSTAAAVIGSLPYHTSITISCQTTGTAVNGSAIWDQLPGGRYVSDYFVSTPVVGGFSPGLARCGTPTPSPTPTPTPTPSARAQGVTTNHNEGSFGQCTSWAITEFHAYSGLWPDFTGPNNGNALYWASNAQAKGWTVVSTPTVASVAVFPIGANGAGSVGHVAWVTAVSGGQITVSEMNYHANGGGFDRVDTRGPFTPRADVRYILAP